MYLRVELWLDNWKTTASSFISKKPVIVLSLLGYTQHLHFPFGNFTLSLKVLVHLIAIRVYLLKQELRLGD